MRVEQYSDNPALKELLSLVGSQRIDSPTAQAAAWHMASNMSWQELAAKARTKLGPNPVPYFTPAELARAEQLVASAIGKAREKAIERDKDPAKADTPAPVSTRQPLKAR